MQYSVWPGANIGCIGTMDMIGCSGLPFVWEAQTVTSDVVGCPAASNKGLLQLLISAEIKNVEAIKVFLFFMFICGFRY
jgi:hypothetical protein